MKLNPLFPRCLGLSPSNKDIKIERKYLKFSGQLKNYLDQVDEGSRKKIMMTLCLAYKDYQMLLKEYEPQEVAKNLFENVDHKIKEFIGDYQKDNLISCKSGCFHCCHYQVEITFEEALVLANYLFESNMVIDRELLETQSKISDSEWYDYPEEIRRCVFIGEKGECRAYQVRPMACRKHNVISSSDFCQGKPGPLIDGITSPVIEAFVSGAISASPETGYLPKMLQKILKQKISEKIN